MAISSPMATRASVVLCMFLLAALIAGDLHARFLFPDFIDVPIERLVSNLERQLEDDPRGTRIDLARLHAMAFARKAEALYVYRGTEIPGGVSSTPNVTTSDDAEKVRVAKEHLARAITRYEEAFTLGATQSYARLGYAWCLQQDGQIDRAIDGYRRLISDSGVTLEARYSEDVVREAILYLVPLLDSDTDRAEIRRLQELAAHLGSLPPRMITPIAVPLSPDIELEAIVDRTARVRFDSDGRGWRREWSWISPSAGWLAYDPRGTGQITSSLQLFGDATFWLFWENGYEPLRALDDDADGVLRAAELEGLVIWRDGNGNGISDEGEVRPVSYWGITQLSTRHEDVAGSPDLQAWAMNGVTFRDGSVRPTYDVLLRPKSLPETTDDE